MQKFVLFFCILTISSSLLGEGVVVSGTPHATDVGQKILNDGGNAFAASIGVALAIFITDPANASLAGRSQVIYKQKGKVVRGIGAATQAPQTLTSKENLPYTAVPVPGNPAAMKQVLKLSNFDLQKILKYIEPLTTGFRLPSKNRLLFQIRSEKLKKSRTLAALFYQKNAEKNFVLHLPALKKTLQILEKEGLDSFYHGKIMKMMQSDLASKGSSLTTSDFENYQSLEPEILHLKFKNYDIYTLGGNTWGHVLIQLLDLYQRTHASISSKQSTALIASIIEQVMMDQPVHLRTLVPKEKPTFSKSELLKKNYLENRQKKILRHLDQGDTTHFSIIDKDGNMVSWTTSLGPWFGAGAALKELGIHYAYSYRMAKDPAPAFRDHTEMSPTLVLRNQEPFLAIGAAGSERIPVAIFWVLLRILFENETLNDAVNAPRFFSFERSVRIHEDYSAEGFSFFRENGYVIDTVKKTLPRHLGIIHAAMKDQNSFSGVADPSYGGKASK